MRNHTCLIASKLSGIEWLQALFDIMLNFHHRTKQRATRKPASPALFLSALPKKTGKAGQLAVASSTKNVLNTARFIMIFLLNFRGILSFARSGQSIKGASCFTEVPPHPPPTLSCAPVLC
ncbi:hypothetical protein [Vibrio algicola]|uniref:Uncharacterized protein n=1 Tax=Vibrio algicola TaxID=2662262 RepID=A0A5Q0TH02_9VIBR|nr:hypothetical protein [Vibrio algicola]